MQTEQVAEGGCLRVLWDSIDRLFPKLRSRIDDGIEEEAGVDVPRGVKSCDDDKQSILDELSRSQRHVYPRFSRRAGRY